MASGTRSNERRQSPGPAVNFGEETYTNGDSSNKSRKSEGDRRAKLPECEVTGTKGCVDELSVPERSASSAVTSSGKISLPWRWRPLARL